MEKGILEWGVVWGVECEVVGWVKFYLFIYYVYKKGILGGF